jgi:hypothetical protein
MRLRIRRDVAILHIGDSHKNSCDLFCHYLQKCTGYRLVRSSGTRMVFVKNGFL